MSAAMITQSLGLFVLAGFVRLVEDGWYGSGLGKIGLGRGG